MIGTVIDIETTGYLKFVRDVNKNSVLSDESEICEVGFMNIDMSTGAIVHSGVLYFYKPYYNLENDAAKKHKLTREFLSQYEGDFENNLIALNALLQSAVIIGKNSKVFDIPFMKAFIEKHGGYKLNIPHLVSALGMKGYNGGTVTYDGGTGSIDMQQVWHKRYVRFVYEKTGIVDDRKKGTLEDYISFIDAWPIVEAVYTQHNTGRVGGCHTAFYDVVMTYVIFMDAKLNGLLDDIL